MKFFFSLWDFENNISPFLLFALIFFMFVSLQNIFFFVEKKKKNVCQGIYLE